jgi:hypothetical protein
MPLVFRSDRASDARFSSCRKYRYWLVRTWDDGLAPVVFVMLNPSLADEVEDDRTVMRCKGFAKSWGHGGIEVVNLFAWIATCPDGLALAAAPVGKENDRAIKTACSFRRVIAAWGGPASSYPARVREVLAIIRRAARSVECLGKTKGGHPRHPSRLRADRMPEPF